MTTMCPAEAYYAQREWFRENGATFSAILDRLNESSDMTKCQWAQLHSVAVDYQPDLILELGRAGGNSTVAFVEAANRLGADRHRVCSICLTSAWDTTTRPLLAGLLDETWFSPLKAIRDNLLTQDYETIIGDAPRVLVFWDAHGYAVAECVLGKILPLLQGREHLVLMHDLADARSMGPEARLYQGQRLWRRNHKDGEAGLFLGPIFTRVEQGVAIADFAARNGFPLHSAEEALRAFFEDHAERINEMNDCLGPDFFGLGAGWFWFSLNEASLPLTFPAFHPPSMLNRLRTTVRIRLEDMRRMMRRMGSGV